MINSTLNWADGRRAEPGVARSTGRRWDQPDAVNPERNLARALVMDRDAPLMDTDQDLARIDKGVLGRGIVRHSRALRWTTSSKPPAHSQICGQCSRPNPAQRARIFGIPILTYDGTRSAHSV